MLPPQYTLYTYTLSEKLFYVHALNILAVKVSLVKAKALFKLYTKWKRCSPLLNGRILF